MDVSVYIEDEIWNKHGTIDLFIGDMWVDMVWQLHDIEKYGDEDEFRREVKNAIVGYILKCSTRRTMTKEV